jgi:glycosyltransferase involved in cell wall biosynthesis
MKDKSILVVYPHNFFARRMGIDSRYYELMSYFKSRNFTVDLFSLKNYESSWDNQDPKEEDLINELFLYDFAGGKLSDRRNWQKIFHRLLKGKAASDIIYKKLPDYAFPGMKRKFKEILSRKQYDFILFSYVYWANLVEAIEAPPGRFILDLSDFTTLNLFDMCEGKIDTAALLEEEIRRVGLFEKVMCISAEEMWFFSQSVRNSDFYHIPFFMKKKKPAAGKKEFDILFVGSDNSFNKKGMDWFFEKVFPLLNPAVRMLIVGRIAAYVPQKENVTCIPFVPDLNEIYNKAQISICPLLGGTGIKIKVIEALSFELPVVTTSKGIVGFPAKLHNGCLVADDPEEFAAHISALLADRKLYQVQSKMAGNYFMENFAESVIHRRLDNMFFPQDKKVIK